MREIRRRLRQLPRDRRKDIASSIREGRAVRDPRDAPLAAVWAERLAAKAQRSPWWLLPLTRPRGWRARFWVVHLVWVLGAVALAYVGIWSLLPGAWRWVLLGFLVYSAITTPFTIRQMLRAYWNAPEAAGRNKQVANEAPHRPDTRPQSSASRSDARRGRLTDRGLRKGPYTPCAAAVCAVPSWAIATPGSTKPSLAAAAAGHVRERSAEGRGDMPRTCLPTQLSEEAGRG